MSVPQGSTALNTHYFTALAARADAVQSCSELQTLYSDMNTSVNATVSAMNSQLSSVTLQVSNLQSQISDLYTHIGTLAATQASNVAVTSQAATAAAVSDLGSAIAYIKAQGLVMAGLGTTTTATLVKQILALNAEYQTITNLYNLVVKQVDTLTTQISAINGQLTSVQSTMHTVASRFPSCSL